MAIKTIPIKNEDTLELYHKAKRKFVNDFPYGKITDENILKAVFENYLED